MNSTNSSNTRLGYYWIGSAIGLIVIALLATNGHPGGAIGLGIVGVLFLIFSYGLNKHGRVS